MSEYLEHFRTGTFWGILRWEQLDALWDAVRAKAEGGWYLYTLDDAPPATPAAADQVRDFIAEVDLELRRAQARDHCGLVYADDREHPAFIQVFHPHRVGGCGTGKWASLPAWTLSLLPPVDIPAALASPRQGWLRRMLGG